MLALSLHIYLLSIPTRVPMSILYSKVLTLLESSGADCGGKVLLLVLKPNQWRQSDKFTDKNFIGVIRS